LKKVSFGRRPLFEAAAFFLARHSAAGAASISAERI
jgi:hypothetical protein